MVDNDAKRQGSWVLGAVPCQHSRLTVPQQVSDAPRSTVPASSAPPITTYQPACPSAPLTPKALPLQD